MKRPPIQLPDAEKGWVLHLGRNSHGDLEAAYEH
jgi:hypothetical protein